jgi:hypothetical protein
LKRRFTFEEKRTYRARQDALRAGEGSPQWGSISDADRETIRRLVSTPDPELGETVAESRRTRRACRPRGDRSDFETLNRSWDPAYERPNGPYFDVPRSDGFVFHIGLRRFVLWLLLDSDDPRRLDSAEAAARKVRLSANVVRDVRAELYSLLERPPKTEAEQAAEGFEKVPGLDVAGQPAADVRDGEGVVRAATYRSAGLPGDLRNVYIVEIGEPRHRCQACGKPLKAYRPNKRFCNAVCRVRRLRSL